MIYSAENYRRNVIECQRLIEIYSNGNTHKDRLGVKLFSDIFRNLYLNHPLLKERGTQC